MSPALQSEASSPTLSAILLLWCAQLLFVVVFTCGALPVQAQEQTDDDEVLRVQTDLLVFPIRVRDKRLAGQLTERDLVIKDDDKVTSGLYLYSGTDRVA